MIDILSCKFIYNFFSSRALLKWRDTHISFWLKEKIVEFVSEAAAAE